MKSESGISFIEILVSLSIVAVITVAFINGMSGAFKGIEISQERVAAESLAKSQIEYIKVQDFVSVATYNPGDPAKSYALIDIAADLIAAGYSVEIDPPQIVISGGEEGFELQSISVVVKRHAESKLRMSFYRVDA